MRKFISICCLIWAGLVISCVSLLGLYLLGPLGATVCGTLGTLWAAPNVYDVMAAAWGWRGGKV